MILFEYSLSLGLFPSLTLRLSGARQRSFVHSIDQDQTAENVQYDLGFTLSDRDISHDIT